MHPEYLSSKFAADLDLPSVAVQHHHAHVAACMVEHGRTEPVVALTFDGLGYGADGTLWGGEVLVADFAGFERVAHLLPVPMPGGAGAIKQPWRMAAVWAERCGVDPAAVLADIDAVRRDAVLDLATRDTTHVTTSMGRLFDAVAVLLGGRREVSFEAQAAIELEAMARRVPRSEAPVIAVPVDAGAVVDPRPLVAELVGRRRAGAEPALLAAAFHESIGRAAASMARKVALDAGLDAVVLTGGVFQNARLTEVVESALAEDGLRVLVHSTVPPNDGGISVGQAAVAAWSTR
jgi:hydrogenase maturation protein HypF